MDALHTSEFGNLYWINGLMVLNSRMPLIRCLFNRRFVLIATVMILGAVLGIASSADSATPSEFEHWEFKVEGVTREALAYVPPTAKEKLTPVVFVFHGHGGHAQNAARMFEMERNWP